MNKEELNRRLKLLNNEDFIWLVYIGIIFMSLYSNTFERKYFMYNDLRSREKYRKITMLIFAILILSYLYFLRESLMNIINLKPYDTSKKKKLTYLSFLASLFIFISGFIFLYISVVDENLDVEIAFN